MNLETLKMNWNCYNIGGKIECDARTSYGRVSIRQKDSKFWAYFIKNKEVQMLGDFDSLEEAKDKVSTLVIC